MVNLDKSYKIFDKCYQIILETDTENQVIIKGGKDYLTVKKEFGEYLDKVHFMPILSPFTFYLSLLSLSFVTIIFPFLLYLMVLNRKILERCHNQMIRVI